MYNNIFRRVEKKYLLSLEKKNLLLDKISKYIEKDKYYESFISNIYYDTKDYDLIVNSIEKPIFKEKLRVRSYGKTTKNSKIFLEIKSKYSGVVGKRRVSLTLKEFDNYIKTGKYPDSQIFREIDYLFKYYDLVPAMFVGYDRYSYKGKDDDSLRITFDSNLRSRNKNLRLDYGDKGDKYFDEDIYIMEIKTLGAMPLWLVNSLSELKIYPTSFSKYGSIYTKMINERCKNVK